MISSFATINQKVLSKSIWGVEFFMVCDRDAVPPVTDVCALEDEARGRLRVLPRYHLENYLLDADVISSVFHDLEPEDSWLQNPDDVSNALLQIARSRLSHTAALYVSSELRQTVGNVDLMPSECHSLNQDEIHRLLVNKASKEVQRVGSALDVGAIEQSLADVWDKLDRSLSDGTWVRLFPGRPVFNTFAGQAHLHKSRLRHAYLQKALNDKPSVFEDITDIFRSFAS